MPNLRACVGMAVLGMMLALPAMAPRRNRRRHPPRPRRTPAPGSGPAGKGVGVHNAKSTRRTVNQRRNT